MDFYEFVVMLVYEVNYVFNCFECSYYWDVDIYKVDEIFVFVEEFCVFYVECWFQYGVQVTIEFCCEQVVWILEECGYVLMFDFEEIMFGELDLLEQIVEELIEYCFWEEGSFGYLVFIEEYWLENFELCD